MANLSQIKRQRMLSFLDSIRNEHIDDDDMLIAIGEIENEINSKKYGLVWEEHEEQVDIKMQDNIPVFIESKDKEITTASKQGYNFLLEGDNLHSLRLLEKTHRGKIDLIYIDPPYNTKEKDFIYNDERIELTDGYRHSKWLSFMEKRLRIASKLLKDNGFIFISIDDNETSQLKLLCDEIFGEENFQNTIFIQVRYPDKTLKQDMSYHKLIEQVHIYGKSSNSKPHLVPIEYDYEKFIYSVEEIGVGTEITLGGKKVFKFEKGSYKIVKNKKGSKKGLKEIWASGTILNGNSSGRFFRDYLTGRKNIDGLGVLYKVYDIGDDMYDYRYFTGPQKATAEKGKYFQGVPIDKLEDNSSKTMPIPNLFDMSGDFGNISKEGGIDFNSGKKPIKMIKMFLDYIDDKNITVLDFFTGSASTAHAVIDKNNEDGGCRKFIVCTNNENNICENKSYPRIANVINGYGSHSGISANLKYYKTDFVSKDADNVSEELLKHIVEMIQLEHGIKIDSNEYFILLSDEDADEMETSIINYPNIKALYISKDVLLTTKQNKAFENVEIHIIPDYYFKFELKEVGEAW